MPIADTSVVKEQIVLEGDIPSAVNPPPGCPFQTRCPRKHQVPGNRCETEVPPMRRAGARATRCKCHLSAEVFAAMRPVIRTCARMTGAALSDDSYRSPATGGMSPTTKYVLSH